MSEFRQIAYRCAITGGSFRVRFERRHPAERFHVVAIDQPTSPKNIALTLKDWLGSWVRRFHRPFVAQLFRAANLFTRSATCSFAADEFDFDGWHCPYCHHGQRNVAPFAFVHCPQCDGLVCGGRLSADSHFRCHDGCGHADTCTDSIERIAGSVSNGKLRPLGSPRATPAILTQVAR